jgi:hypothetical protein
MKVYITKSTKSSATQKLINEALDILEQVGIPVDKTQRRLEKMAMAFLSLAGVTQSWKKAKGQNEDRHLGPKEIISYINDHYEENISRGSYDDIRDNDLELMILADLVLRNVKNPNAPQNSPKTKYTLHADFKNLIIYYNTDEWNIKCKLFLKNRSSLSEILERKRKFTKIPVVLPNDILVELRQGGHNQLQREIIDEFIHRFAKGSDVLYIGDAEKRIELYYQKEKLTALGFYDLSRKQLPDIILYNEKKNWLYLIEAFYSSGSMSEERVLKFKKNLQECKVELIFITAFTSQKDFKKHVNEIAWETEVWTADRPDHMVHFNGEKFLGPYK